MQKINLPPDPGEKSLKVKPDPADAPKGKLCFIEGITSV
jgi:hypothetical protein